MLGIDKLNRLIHVLDQKLDHVAQAVHEMDHRIISMQERLETVPTRQEFDAAMEALRQAIADETVQVTEEIQKLRDQIASGVPITDADLASLQARISEVKNVDPDAAPTG